MSPSTQARIPAVETEFVFVEIPGTQLTVSRVALGTWAMGGWMWGGTDRRESIATIRAALHQGINLIDTAPMYGFGVSEEIVGSVALWGARHPDQVAAALGVAGWSLNTYDKELVERIVNAAVIDPVGPEFMAPPRRAETRIYREMML
jgi:aryl-alcohol dehydrogenase-like predicted oxidoreductase